MTISFECSAELDKQIMAAAAADGHNNRSAVIRKALAYFLANKSQKVAVPNKKGTNK